MPDTVDAVAPVYLVRGDDPGLIAQAARSLIDRLVGEESAALVVEEHGGAGTDDLDVGRVLDAYTTPPFLVARRVVVVRDVGRLGADDVKRLTGPWAARERCSTPRWASGAGAAPG
jgi:DNA polymerase III delta subunit